MYNSVTDRQTDKQNFHSRSALKTVQFRVTRYDGRDKYQLDFTLFGNKYFMRCNNADNCG